MHDTVECPQCGRGFHWSRDFEVLEDVSGIKIANRTHTVELYTCPDDGAVVFVRATGPDGELYNSSRDGDL